MNDKELAYGFLEKLVEEFKFKKVPTLEPINVYLDFFERPELSYKNRVIVTGTAGKGTTCRAIEKCLISEGVSTLTLYSPHIQTVLERVRVCGRLVSKDLFVRVLNEVRLAVEEVGVRISYYECLVLVGILVGKYEGCETLICEVGLGGDFDATNAISGSRISALTFIDFDHQDVLGHCLEDIARKKLGIVTKDSLYFLTYERGLKDFFLENCVVEPEFFEFSNFPNEKLAVKVCEKILGRKVNEVPKVKLPCRFERVVSNVFLDGAHSKPRFESLAEKIKKVSGRKVGVIGMLQNHDYEELAKVVELFDEVVWTKIEFVRPFYEPEFLRYFFGCGSISKDVLKTVNEFRKRDCSVFVLGSFYLAGKVRESFINSELIEKSGSEFLD